MCCTTTCLCRELHHNLIKIYHFAAFKAFMRLRLEEVETFKMKSCDLIRLVDLFYCWSSKQWWQTRPNWSKLLHVYMLIVTFSDLKYDYLCTIYLGIVTGPTSTAEEDEFDLSQHDGRNLAFQMKNSNVQPSPCYNGATPTGLMWVSLSKYVQVYIYPLYPWVDKYWLRLTTQH